MIHAMEPVISEVIENEEQHPSPGLSLDDVTQWAQFMNLKHRGDRECLRNDFNEHRPKKHEH